jgi:glycosyltransferase involved in cell wall biosynthesis
LGLSSAWPLIGLIGRLEYQKNHEAFFRVIQKLKEVFPRVMGVCVGDGRRRQQLEDEVSEQNLRENIVFLGNRSDVSAILQVLDVQVLPSRWEGLPNVLLEGMLYRLPIVATAVGGVPEVIRDGYNGFLVAVDDDMAMSERIVDLLRNPDLRHSFCEQGYQRLAADFSVANAVEKTQFYYQHVVQAARSEVEKL